MCERFKNVGAPVGWALGVLAAVTLLAACYKPAGRVADAWTITDSERQQSLSFEYSHHYSFNYNFIIKADTVRMVRQQPDELPFDSVYVNRKDRVVVADIMIMPRDTVDSVWVKIARDQGTLGWLHEKDLLASAVPDDTVSQFINLFADSHRIVFAAVILSVLAAYTIRALTKRKAYIVHLRDIDSFYPTLLALLVAAAAVYYASIQLFAAESWRHFYFHPSLNPFALPPHLCAFLCIVWAVIIVAIAAVNEARRALPRGDAALYLLGTAAVCIVDYIVFSLSTLFYIGYPLLAVYCAFALYRYCKYARCKYVCGSCGAPLRDKGRCPRCGALNE